MCGIVGLHLRNDSMHGELGRLLTPMLDCMATRGPDSAGLAIYGSAAPEGRSRYSVRIDGFDRLPGHGRTRGGRSGSPPGAMAGEPDEPIEDLIERVTEALTVALGDDVDVELIRPDGAVLVALDDERAVVHALAEVEPRAIVLGHGRQVEIVKATGEPIDVCRRYDIESRSGFQGIGHTRMATESAVTTDHSHPFAPNPDLAVVHNGSFSNHPTVRRRLEREGISCVTDNDTEVCARLIGRELDAGSTLATALKEVGNQMDGFYTLLVSHSSGFAVVRDSFACKPLVVAEHADYVAVTSEYVAMAGLPGIDNARVFEPMPGDIHAWERS
jgi:glutamate synthase domain-containing protein 1